jgi:DNA-directed RNA polymerase beta' subunit
MQSSLKNKVTTSKPATRPQPLNFTDFSAIRISLMSPEEIRRQSYGEVKKAETLNYNTLKPERDGLFCERIFGPVRNWECSCGKYKMGKYKGIICDRCGVEVTESKVRRERMGHIELAVPVVHPWFLWYPPFYISTLIEVPQDELKQVAYYGKYILLEDLKDADGNIVKVYVVKDDIRGLDDKMLKVEVDGKIVEFKKGVCLSQSIYDSLMNRLPTELKEIVKNVIDVLELRKKTVISNDLYRYLKNEYSVRLKADIGASAILKLLSEMDLKKEKEDLMKKIKKYEEKGVVIPPELFKRFALINEFINSGNKPEWMILKALPVLPADLRPLVILEGGKPASSDLNELYRRIINRNNRLKNILTHTRTPDILVHNEKRLLQEAVDALIDNGVNGKVVLNSIGRPYKSLSDIIAGKTGRFRQNLLGKRVDYSGRSVIVVGPQLKFYQCGLPKQMALELFKPFVLRELINTYNKTHLGAKAMIQRGTPEVWGILEKITKNYVVLLNRAPTLHRPSIQAFEPVLIDSKAIQIHPFVCTPYNADFDGDQMAVHVPLSIEAQLEARYLLFSPYNIFSPGSGKPLAISSQDVVLGCNYLTKEKLGEKGEGKIFYSLDEVITCYQLGEVDLHARIKVKGINALIEPSLSPEEQRNPELWKDYTTVGRVIFNLILPPELRFINKEITKKLLTALVEECYHKLGLSVVVDLLDKIKSLGFHYATVSGLTISVADMTLSPNKKKWIEEYSKEVEKINENARQNIITEIERYNKVIDIWTKVTEDVSKDVQNAMKAVDKEKYDPERPRFNAIYMMAYSGARGSMDQVRQLCGMRGLMSKVIRKFTGGYGDIIEYPVTSSFREGLSILEYFISAHGGRKGLVDTALKTAQAGYLTRRLVDAAHSVMVTMEDCGTPNWIDMKALKTEEEVLISLKERIVGRVAARNITWVVEESGIPREEIIVKKGDIITAEQAEKLEKVGIEYVPIRSVLVCEAPYGVCAKCYGVNLATHRLVEVGEAVGVIAAQSIGEPGTQLTLRTFHIGGASARIVESAFIEAGIDGEVEFKNDYIIVNRWREFINLSRNMVITIRGENRKIHYNVPYGAKIKLDLSDSVILKDGFKVKISPQKAITVKRHEVLATWDLHSQPIISEHSGIAKFYHIIEGKTLLTTSFGIETMEQTERKIHLFDKKLVPRIFILNRDNLYELGRFLEKNEKTLEQLKEKITSHVKKDKSAKMKSLKELTISQMADLCKKLSDEVGKENISDKETFSVELEILINFVESFLFNLNKLSGDKKMAPEMQELINECEKVVKERVPAYFMSKNTRILIEDFQKVEPGDVLAKIPVETVRVRDITGGLPRVEELFEARVPKDPAIISPISGYVKIKYEPKENVAKVIIDSGSKTEVKEVPLGQKHLIVRDGDHVEAGDPLTDGEINPHDILETGQIKKLQEFLTDEIQRVYRLQNVVINDKHIEIIVRQMLSFVEIVDSGDSSFLKGEIVKKYTVEKEQEKLRREKKTPPKFKPVLLGIKEVALRSDSFMSAASFQETIRVLARASIRGDIDRLMGLKENVIVGHLVPVGTGWKDYRKLSEKKEELEEWYQLSTS